MPYYRRRRRGSGDPIRDLMIDLLSLILVALFICGFVWVFSQPSMWNFNFIARPTPTAVPGEVASSGSGWGAIAILGIIAAMIGGLGLFLIGVIWFITRVIIRPRVVRSSPSPAHTLQFQPTGPVPEVSPEANSVPLATETAEIDHGTPHVAVMPALPEVKLDVEAHRLMKSFERSFFWALRHALGEDYYIFTQVPLRELVPAAERQRITRELSGMLFKGIVDFVLADPVTLQARLACEFDDPSHRLADARARDRRKDEFLRRVGLPLARFPSNGKWDPETLRKTIHDAMGTDRAIAFLSERESQFFHVLRDARGDLFIFPKVALKSLIHRRQMLPFETFRTWETETVSFVLAHPKYVAPVAVIDLRSSPNAEKDRLLGQAGIPFLCLDENSTPKSAELRAQIGYIVHSPAPNI